MSDHRLTTISTGAVKTLTIEQAAALASLSPSRIRTLRRFGELDPALIDGRHGVTAESLEYLMAFRKHRREAIDLRKLKAARRKRQPFQLRLVVDNTVPTT